MISDEKGVLLTVRVLFNDCLKGLCILLVAASILIRHIHNSGERGFDSL